MSKLTSLPHPTTVAKMLSEIVKDDDWVPEDQRERIDKAMEILGGNPDEEHWRINRLLLEYAAKTARNPLTMVAAAQYASLQSAEVPWAQVEGDPGVKTALQLAIGQLTTHTDARSAIDMLISTANYLVQCYPEENFNLREILAIAENHVEVYKKERNNSFN